MHNMTPGNPVSDRIRAAMATAKVTQVQLGAALDLPQAGISSRLAGRTDWRLGELTTAARVLGTDLGTLLGSSPAEQT